MAVEFDDPFPLAVCPQLQQRSHHAVMPQSCRCLPSRRRKSSHKPSGTNISCHFSKDFDGSVYQDPSVYVIHILNQRRAISVIQYFDNSFCYQKTKKEIYILRNKHTKLETMNLTTRNSLKTTFYKHGDYGN
jgi:hypothetical protein